ncbi:MAG: hypothetical protein JSS56_19095 [Proteobacteria bacterium]|nr:hypothetical protein [Pseudomonadota bacterium]
MHSKKEKEEANGRGHICHCHVRCGASNLDIVDIGAPTGAKAGPAMGKNARFLIESNTRGWPNQGTHATIRKKVLNAKGRTD